MLRIPIFRRALPIRLLPATATTILSNSTTSGGSARACRRSLISPGPSAAPMPPTSSTKRLSFIVPRGSRGSVSRETRPVRFRHHQGLPFQRRLRVAHRQRKALPRKWWSGRQRCAWRLENQLDSHAPGWPAPYRSVCYFHDFRVWLLCFARSRTEQIRWSAKRGPVAEPRGLYEPARRDEHRPVGSLALGRRPDAVLWPRFSPTGLLPVQRFPHLRKHALGVPIRVIQPHQPSQLLASRI